MVNYLKRYGETLVRNGYSVIPIVAGSKSPPIWMSHKRGDPWSEVKPSTKRVREWLDDRRLTNPGVGIVCGDVSGVDLDIRHPDISAEMREICEERLGFGPQRIGYAPKRLLLFRCTERLRKMSSPAYIDEKGRKCQVEVLNAGEQFVAYAVHPDTGKEYEWVDGRGPHNTPLADLPVITKADIQEIIAAFVAIAEKRGWKKEGTGTRALSTDPEDWTEGIDPGPTEHTIEQAKEILHRLPNDDVAGTQSYDAWLWAGMALYHQTAGSDEGLEIWKEWSAQSSKHVAAECDKKWPSFAADNKARRPITLRWILRVTEETRQAEIKETADGIKANIAAATTIDQIRAHAAKVKHLDIDNVQRETFAGLVQQRIQSVSGQKIPVALARSLVRFEAKTEPAVPEWVAPWVYISGSNEFYNWKHRTSMTPAAFDSAHTRLFVDDKMKREGKAYADCRPSDVALNIHRIPVVDRRAYKPGEPTVFTLDGVPCVNTYSDVGVPSVPETPTAKDAENLRFIQRHIRWHFPDAREEALFVSWLSHVAKGGRVRWAILVHGVEGNGKTFYFELMGSVLGPSNVKVIAPRDLEQQFTSWAEGSQFSLIEEIKVAHGRFDVMNALKPIITNDVVSVRRMRTDSYMVPNTASYMALTNYADALPIDGKDRRYMILQTAPQKSDVDALPADYFTRLFAALKESAGAIRGWLLSYEPHPEFNPNGRAPMTNSKQLMLDLTENDEVRAIRACLAANEGVPGLSERLLRTDLLAQKLMDMGEAVPATRTMNRALMDMGLTYIGRVRVADGDRPRWWSNQPSAFMVNGEASRDRILAWLDPDL